MHQVTFENNCATSAITSKMVSVQVPISQSVTVQHTLECFKRIGYFNKSLSLGHFDKPE